MKIQNDCVVGMHYTLTNDAGEVLDTSDGSDPLVYVQGAGNIIPGLEAAMVDKTMGDKLDVVVEPLDGYGPRVEELIQEVPIGAFEGVEEMQVGMQFQADTEQGPLPVRVTGIDGDTVTVDGNHELAGVRLNFAVSIETVREATEEEVSHGHAH